MTVLLALAVKVAWQRSFGYTCLKGEEIPLFFFHGMARLVQMERELTIERTRTGLETARKPGRNGGRKHRMTEGKIESAKNCYPTVCRPEM